MTLNVSKLKWACRRGMLELDVLLTNFLVEAYPKLNMKEQGSFVTLLSYPDPDLFSWLMGFTQPEDEKLVKIIKRIRSHARSRI